MTVKMTTSVRTRPMTRSCPECNREMGRGTIRFGGKERRLIVWRHCPMCNLSVDRREVIEG